MLRRVFYFPKNLYISFLFSPSETVMVIFLSKFSIFKSTFLLSPLMTVISPAFNFPLSPLTSQWKLFLTLWFSITKFKLVSFGLTKYTAHQSFCDSEFRYLSEAKNKKIELRTNKIVIKMVIFFSCILFSIKSGGIIGSINLIKISQFPKLSAVKNRIDHHKIGSKFLETVFGFIAARIGNHS